jgi:outer membrane lipoprotein-sorting protein
MLRLPRIVWPINKFSLFLLGLSMLLTVGCPQQGPPLENPIPIGEGIATRVTTVEVLQQIEQRQNQFESLSGWGKIGIQNWEERYRFNQAFVLQKPGSFRLETLGALDQPAVFLTSNEMILSFYTKKENKFYTGVASQENLFKLSSLNFSVADTIRVLSGNPPRLSQVNSEWGMPLNEETYYIERTSIQDEIMQRIWFDTTTMTISKVQEYMLRNGILFVDIDFKEYRDTQGGYPVPAKILIDRPFDKTRVEVKYTSMLTNQPIDQTLFTFTPPADAKQYVIDTFNQEEFEQLTPYEQFRVNE